MRTKVPRTASHDQLVERAIDAYLGASVVHAPLPFNSDSSVVLDSRQRFVVLRRAKRILAVYLVSGGGKLKHLPRKEYPTSLAPSVLES
jgi:hypothetical protein